MTLIFVLRCTVVILMILKSQVEGSCSNRPQDVSNNCCIHYYKDGSFCKECPMGYHGYNCSETCRYPFYGSLCSHICTCSPCHPIYGCNSTQDTTESTMIATIDGTEIIIQTNESSTSTEPEDVTEHSIYTEGSNIITRRNIIFFTGSLVSVGLMMVIIRETYKYRKIKTPPIIYPSANVIYEDVAV